MTEIDIWKYVGVPIFLIVLAFVDLIILDEIARDTKGWK